MKRIERIHRQRIHGRRFRVPRDHSAELAPPGSRVLGVDTGDGPLARLSRQQRTTVTLRGLDALLDGQPYIPVEAFDGRGIPYGGATFDLALSVDRMHRTEDPIAFLHRAVRVARQTLAPKGHTFNGFLAHLPLADERCTAWG